MTTSRHFLPRLVLLATASLLGTLIIAAPPASAIGQFCEIQERGNGAIYRYCLVTVGEGGHTACIGHHETVTPPSEPGQLPEHEYDCWQWIN